MRQLLIHDRREETSLIAIHRPVLRRGIAHALEHHLQHHALELLRSLLEAGLRVLFKTGTQIRRRLRIKDKMAGIEFFGFHKPNISNFRARNRNRDIQRIGWTTLDW